MSDVTPDHFVDILQVQNVRATLSGESSGNAAMHFPLSGPYSHEDPGICPVCKRPMRTVQLATKELVFFCPENRIAMPIPLSAPQQSSPAPSGV